MFGILNNLTKAVVGVVVELPMSAVVDLASAGSAHPKMGETYTGDAVRGIMDNIQKATKGGG